MRDKELLKIISIHGSRIVHPPIYEGVIKPLLPITLSPEMEELKVRMLAQQIIEDSCDCPICQNRRNINEG